MYLQMETPGVRVPPNRNMSGHAATKIENRRLVWKNKYDREMPQTQTNSWHHEEETQNIVSDRAARTLLKVKQPALSSLVR